MQDGERETENTETTRKVEEAWPEEERARARDRQDPTPPPGVRDADTGAVDWGKEGGVDGAPVGLSENTAAELAPLPEGPEVQGPPIQIPGVWLPFAPYVQIGKLFFEVDGEPYRGSACVIGPNLLVTVAHNVYLDGEWSERIEFWPACDNNYGAHGVWVYDRAWVPDQWWNTQADGHDVGLIRLRPGGLHGQPIGQVVGALGYAYQRNPQGGSWRDVGYPGNYQNAAFMYGQDGDYTRTLDNGAVVGMTGTLGRGTSGGPWLFVDQHAHVRVFGLHGFHDPNYPGEVFSPFFARWTHDFIQRHI